MNEREIKKKRDELISRIRRLIETPCATILDRWEKFTGQKAIKVE